MKWRRLLSFKRWTQVFKRLPRLLRAPQIPLGEKLLYHPGAALLGAS